MSKRLGRPGLTLLVCQVALFSAQVWRWSPNVVQDRMGTLEMAFAVMSLLANIFGFWALLLNRNPKGLRLAAWLFVASMSTMFGAFALSQ